MIAPLRRRHLRLVVALAIVAPVVLLAALDARPPAATTDSIPAALAERDPRPSSSPDFESSEVFEHQNLRLRAWLQSDGAILSLEAESPLTAPDLLLYGSPQAAESGASLPAGAVFLAAVPGHGERAFVVPPGAPTDHLLLFSLAWGQVVDSVARPYEGSAGAAGGGR